MTRKRSVFAFIILHLILLAFSNGWTEVDLISFKAFPGDSEVLLEWITASENENAGFRLYRDGTNRAFIQGAGTSTTESTYTFLDQSVANEITYSYRLSSISTSGTEMMFDTVLQVTPSEEFYIPAQYILGPIEPNPFNTSTIIFFELPQGSLVTLEVFNVLGAKVSTLVDVYKKAGRHSAYWHAGDLPNGAYFCRMKAGGFEESTVIWLLKGIGTESEATPKGFALHQNYPNPFNPSTEICYALPSEGHVTLKVYNILGAEVAQLIDADQKANFYTVRWDARGLASGVYFCRLKAGDFEKTIKMILLK